MRVYSVYLFSLKSRECRDFLQPSFIGLRKHFELTYFFPLLWFNMYLNPFKYENIIIVFIN